MQESYYERNKIKIQEYYKKNNVSVICSECGISRIIRRQSYIHIMKTGSNRCKSCSKNMRFNRQYLFNENVKSISQEIMYKNLQEFIKIKRLSWILIEPPTKKV